MNEELKIFKKTVSDVGIISLAGDVTSLAEEQINAGFDELAEQGLKKVIFDFTPVSYINSSGIAILIGIINKAKQKGQKLSVAGLSPHFQKIFRMVGLTRFVEVYDSVESALDCKGVNANVCIPG